MSEEDLSQLGANPDKRELVGDSLEGLVRQFPKKPRRDQEVVIRPSADVQVLEAMGEWAEKNGWRWVMSSVWGMRFIYQPNTDSATPVRISNQE